MPDPRKQARIEEFMRKRLLGEELIDTQFHLFSARSPLAGRVLKPRALCANNVLLAKSSKYFLDLAPVLSTDIHPSHPSLADLADDHDIPGSAPIDEYGYESDSDLDECNDSIQVTRPEAQQDRSASKDDKLYVDGPGSVRSDMVVSPEQPREEGSFAVNLDGAGSIASSETAIQEHAGDNLKELATRNQMAMRLRSLASRHVFVKDTAFQTWYTLLNYLHTDKFNFLPLKSTTPSGQPRASSTSSLDEPRCSAKSMYRLACKVGLDRLRDEAFAHIRSNLTEHNIIQELSCSLLSTHPELLKMELDVLYAHMASPPVVAHFPGLARRIANKELAHGADIVIWTHTQLLKVSPSRTQPSSGSGLWQTAPSRLGSGLGLRNAASAGPADGAERAAASAGDTSKGDVKGEDGNQRTGVACDPAPVPAPAFAPLGVNVGPVPLPSSSWTKVPSAFGPPSPSWFVPPPSSTTSEATFGSLRGQPSQATTSSSGGKEGVACDPPPAPSFVPPPSSTTSEAKASDPASVFTSAWGQPSQTTTSSSEGNAGFFSFDRPPAPRSTVAPFSFFEKAGPSLFSEEHKTGPEESEAVPRAKFLVGQGPIKVNTPSAELKPFSFATSSAGLKPFTFARDPEGAFFGPSLRRYSHADSAEDSVTNTMGPPRVVFAVVESK